VRIGVPESNDCSVRSLTTLGVERFLGLVSGLHPHDPSNHTFRASGEKQEPRHYIFQIRETFELTFHALGNPIRLQVNHSIGNYLLRKSEHSGVYREARLLSKVNPPQNVHYVPPGRAVAVFWHPTDNRSRPILQSEHMTRCIWKRRKKKLPRY
jgi:hypothetical protein